MRNHPWLTLAASAVAGFAASAALVPSKEEQALKKLAKIERALNPAPPPKRKADDDASASDGDGTTAYKSGRSSFARTLLGEVIKAVQPAVVSMLTAGVAGHVARPSEADMQAAAAAEDAGTAPAS
jgi:hypothetical protein